WVFGDGRVHCSARLVATKRNARCVDRNSVRSQRAKFRFRNYVTVRRKKTDPRLSPSIRLPHALPLPQNSVPEISPRLRPPLLLHGPATDDRFGSISSFWSSADYFRFRPESRNPYQTSACLRMGTVPLRRQSAKVERC